MIEGDLPFTSALHQHAERWSAPTVSSGGTSIRHLSMASGQRGWKRQPPGGSDRLGGRPPSAGLRVASPMRGRLATKCAV